MCKHLPQQLQVGLMKFQEHKSQKTWVRVINSESISAGWDLQTTTTQGKPFQEQTCSGGQGTGGFMVWPP